MITTEFSAETLAQIAGRFSEAEFLEKGCVQIISVDAIRERSSARWKLRSDAVADFVKRQFRKEFNGADLVTQVDDTAFLLLQPATERYEAEAKAIGLLSDVLEFFLGASASADLRVGTVTAIQDGAIVQEPIARERLDAPRVKGAAKSKVEVKPDPAALTRKIDGVERRSWQVQGDVDYKVFFMVEPIWSVEKRAIVSHRLKPLIFKVDADGETLADPTRLSTKDRIRVDVVILAEAARLITEADEGRRFGLHVPIHHSTISSSAGRQAVLWRLEALGPLARLIVPCLHGFERGLPSTQLAEFMAPLQRVCLGVSVRLSDLESDGSVWRSLRPSAISLDFEDVSIGASKIQQRLRTFATRCNGAAPALVACSLPSRALMLMAWAEGFTHITGDFLAEQTGGDLRPIRFTPSDLYPEVSGRVAEPALHAAVTG